MSVDRALEIVQELRSIEARTSALWNELKLLSHHAQIAPPGMKPEELLAPSQLETTQKSEDGGEFECENCSARLQDQEALEEHVASHKAEDARGGFFGRNW